MKKYYAKGSGEEAESCPISHIEWLKKTLKVHEDKHDLKNIKLLKTLITENEDRLKELNKKPLIMFL